MIYVQLSGKLLPLKRRKVVTEEQNGKKKLLGRYLNQVIEWQKGKFKCQLSENDSAAIVDADQSTNIGTDNEVERLMMMMK